MNKTLTHALLTTTLSLIFYSGNAQKIFSDYDGKADWQNYKTYAWVAPGDSVFNRYRDDKVFAGSITYAANQELKKKGMRIDTLQPQAILRYTNKVPHSVLAWRWLARVTTLEDPPPSRVVRSQNQPFKAGPCSMPCTIPEAKD